MENKYGNLMSVFVKDESTPASTNQIMVPKRQRKTPFIYSTVKVKSKTRQESLIQDVIASSAVTILFFGSPIYKKSNNLVYRLKKLHQESQKLNLPLDIVYIPLYTFNETALIVEDDFVENHGNWWIMGFQTWEATEAVYMHGIDAVPHLVVVDQDGRIITASGQNDLSQIGNNVLISWF